MIASISCQQKINRHVNVQIWHGCISPLHVSGFHSMAIWIRPKPVRYATWKSNGAICVCILSLKTSCISYLFCYFHPYLLGEIIQIDVRVRIIFFRRGGEVNHHLDNDGGAQTRCTTISLPPKIRGL